jgi:TolB-like protein
MVTGKPPFSGEHEQAIIYSILNSPPDPVSRQLPTAPKAIERILAQALAKNPADRYQKMCEFAADLDLFKDAVEREAKNQASPGRRASRARVWIGLGAVVAVVAVAALLAKTYLSQPQEKPITSIAVLPLRNLSGDPAQDYFSDGMTDAIIKELSQIQALRVISMTSVMRYKNTQKPIPEIARELEIDAVVEGSVLRAGDEVRITAQLIAARPEKHLWADDFTRTLENVLVLQSEVAQAIAAKVKVAVTPQEKERLAASRAVDPEAHEAYLKGNYFLSKPFTSDAWLKSIEYFQQAIDKDPTYAPAYAGLGKAYDNMASMGIQSPRELFPKVRTYAEKALALDPSLAEGVLLMADVKFASDWDIEGAEEYFKKAIELDPNLALAHFWYGFYLTSRRRLHEGLAEMKRGLRIDPVSPFTFYIAYFHAVAGEYDSTSAYLEKIAEIHDDPVLMSSARCVIYVRLGRYAEAVEECQNAVAGKAPYALDNLATAYALSGQADKAQEVLAELLESIGDRYYSPISIACIYCALGDREKMLEYLEKGYQERDIFLVMPAMVPCFGFDCMQSEPRYREIMKEVGVEL